MAQFKIEVTKIEIPILLLSTMETLAERHGKSSQDLVIEVLGDYIQREGVTPPNAKFVIDRLENFQGPLGEMGVKHLSLFGSVARGEEKSGSDIDILVDFFAGESPDIFQFGRIRTKIQSHLETQAKLDLYMKKGSRPKFLESIKVDEKQIF